MAKCEKLEGLGVRYSVGVVGIAEHMSQIEMLRAELPEHVYLWVNAYKSSKEVYGQEQHDFFSKIDPLFPINNTYHASAGNPSDLESMLRPRLCSKASCDCHIGYVHMPSTKLKEVFGANILERIPVRSFRSNSGASR